MIIREEAKEDFGQIYDLVKVAFETAKVSNGKEQDYVNQLRNSENYIPELALVAEENGKLIGQIMLTKMPIINGEIKHETLLLGPISVVLELRNKGIGSQLIKESFRRAKQLKYGSVVLVGDPAYYHRFGFRPSVDFNIKYAHFIPDENVMACELIPNALQGVSGTFCC
ncbi:MAG: GNAT family N-acetyltransferase [Planctomycetes bacterium GWF2_50_10]|nr:MAG: GNAT family N-acetyltransferase [Planctomycetes bacterium GWF2_50_10]